MTPSTVCQEPLVPSTVNVARSSISSPLSAAPPNTTSFPFAPVCPWNLRAAGWPSVDAVSQVQPSAPVVSTLTPSSPPPKSATWLCDRLVIWPNLRFSGAAPDVRLYVHGSSKSIVNGEPRMGMTSCGSPRSSYPTSMRYRPALGTE